MRFRICSLFLAYFLLAGTFVYSQTAIFGNIINKRTQKELIGVQVYLEDSTSTEGTISDNFGTFDLTLDKEPPFYLSFSLLGYQNTAVLIDQKDQYIKVSMVPEGSGDGTVMVESFKGQEEILAASRTRERKVQTTVSVDNHTILDLYNAPYPDFYQNVANLKEAHLHVSSLTLSSVNTRGFSDVQNWRFVQYLDGVELTPGLNFSLGNLLGSSFLDMRSMELVPGTTSSLYGANTFNGLLSMYTKNPFDYPGVSVYTTGGISQQDLGGTNPFWETGFRIAQAYNDRLAFKVNASYLNAYDWEAGDQSYHIRPQDIVRQAELLALPRVHPNFDAVHVYGDEVVVGVDLGEESGLTQINRSGFQEKDLIDYNIENYKVNAALHYKVLPDLEASYQFRFSAGDGIMRHRSVNPLVNVQNTIHRLGLKGRGISLLAYHMQENTQDSYQLLATGAFIQEKVKDNEEWARDYGLAFRGEIPGVEAGDHVFAREFADRDVPRTNSIPFHELLDDTRTNPDFTSGGSRFIDKSRMLHVEGIYSLDSLVDVADIQLGASFRRYSLDSEGQYFNDGPTGFGEPINVTDLGAFVQFSKDFWDERAAVNAAIRWDKNSNFAGRLSPRISGRVGFGSNQEHTIRVSFQQGFRNPAPMEGYKAKDLIESVALGGIQENIEQYTYLVGDQNVLSGPQIISSLVTLDSYRQFIDSGRVDPEILQPLRFPTLEQERITSFEVGYFGKVLPILTVDANVYYNQYQGFIYRVQGYSPLADRVFSTYSNVQDQISSLGASISGIVDLPGSYTAEGSFTFASFDADAASANTPEFLPGFNTPESRVRINVSNPVLWNNVGFSVNYNWNSSFVWQSPFGQGEVPSYGTLDLAVFCPIPQWNFRAKLGATNLLGKDYQTMYGGPLVGSQYFLTLIYDSF